MLQVSEQSARRRRPRAVSFVAILLVVEAVLVVLYGAAIATAELAGVPLPADAPDHVFAPFVGTLPGLGLALMILVAGGGLALASVGLLHLREWAWVLAMAFQGFGLANGLYETFVGQPQYLTL